MFELFKKELCLRALRPPRILVGITYLSLVKANVCSTSLGRREVSLRCVPPTKMAACRTFPPSRRGRATSLVSGELVLRLLLLGTLGLSLGLLLIELHELGKIELGLLEELDLSDEHILKREDL